MRPEMQVAADFMAHKGYPDAEPVDYDKLDGQPCWYLVYELPEGTLELEVSWDGGEWDTRVTTFRLAE